MMIAAVIMLLVIATMTAAFLLVVTAHTRVLGDEHRRTAALNLAEAGVEIALARMQTDAGYSGEPGVRLDGGTLDIEVWQQGNDFAINARGRVQTSGREITRRVRVAGHKTFFGDSRLDTWQELSR